MISTPFAPNDIYSLFLVDLHIFFTIQGACKPAVSNIPTEKHTKSFEELQKINPDIIGWIRINETNVNYPLLQAEDDDTYMNTDAEGKYSLSGSIFLHCANKPDFSDFNNMIYGHHMEKHMMFGDVGLFADKEYFDEHPYGNLFF